MIEGGFGSFRDVVEATGADTVTFLHAICSQDVATMVDGDVRWSFLLTPQGKVVAHFRIYRVRNDTVSLDVEEGFGGQLLSTLRRYLIRTKCTLSLRAAVPVLSFDLGPDEAPVGIVGERTIPGHPLLGGVDAFFADGSPFEYDASTLAQTERRRIASGLPAMGRELDEASIPNATGLLSWTVNFGKGCYIGQELVERIDSRAGTAPARLVRLSSDTPLSVTSADAPKSGLRITSVAETDQRWVALGWAARTCAVGDVVDGARIVGDVGPAR